MEGGAHLSMAIDKAAHLDSVAKQGNRSDSSSGSTDRSRSSSTIVEAVRWRWQEESHQNHLSSS